MDTSRAEALRILCYPPEWDAHGLPSSALLSEQLHTFRTGDDHSTEHYRYVAFRALLKEAPFSDERVALYVSLVDADPDRLMAHAALIDLLNHRDLTDAQFEQVAQHPWLIADPRFVERRRLLRAR